MKKDLIVLVVADHGGLNAMGEYPRRDKRSPQVPPGIYEGEWNRRTAEAVVHALATAGIVAQLVNPGPVNQPHKSIIGYINDTVRRASRIGLQVCVLEIHCNSDEVIYYDERGWTDAHGCVQFVSKRASTTSVKLAHKFNYELETLGYAISSRGVKEKNFNVITKTSCPAWLFEAAFMSNKEDVTHLQDSEQVGIICRAAVNTIKAVYPAE